MNLDHISDAKFHMRKTIAGLQRANNESNPVESLHLLGLIAEAAACLTKITNLHDAIKERDENFSKNSLTKEAESV